MSRKIMVRMWGCSQNKYVDGTFVCVSTEGTLFSLDAPYIFEQYTGLKDKNDKEIYEGDIVEIGKYGKYQIIWNEWACKFDFDKIGKREREEPLLSQDWEQEAEVIGNIHENGDLLK